MNERIVFQQEISPAQMIKVILAGDLTEDLLEAIESFIEQRRRGLADQSARP